MVFGFKPCTTCFPLANRILSFVVCFVESTPTVGVGAVDIRGAVELLGSLAPSLLNQKVYLPEPLNDLNSSFGLFSS